MALLQRCADAGAVFAADAAFTPLRFDTPPFYAIAELRYAIHFAAIGYHFRFDAFRAFS